MSKENPLEEYKIISDNLRWYSNMRFAQLTLFVAITAAILNGIYNDKISNAAVLVIALKVGGILASAMFWYLEMRADDYWSYFMKRGVELEKDLKFRQYTDRPIRKLRTTAAIRFFITAIGVFWTVFLFL
jgi:hypothetical protein